MQPSPGLPPAPQAQGSAGSFSCFLTHDWGVDEAGRNNHTRVAKVYQSLKLAGLNPWFDGEQMRGDIVRQMTDGIDKSDSVVVFVTQRYIAKAGGSGADGANDNCKLEFDYAAQRKRIERIIPVVMEARCKDPSTWSGAVGMRLGGKLYVDMSSDEPAAYNAALGQLISEIRRHEGSALALAPAAPSGGQGHPQPAMPPAAPVTTSSVGVAIGPVAPVPPAPPVDLSAVTAEELEGCWVTSGCWLYPPLPLPCMPVVISARSERHYKSTTFAGPIPVMTHFLRSKKNPKHWLGHFDACGQAGGRVLSDKRVLRSRDVMVEDGGPFMGKLWRLW